MTGEPYEIDVDDLWPRDAEHRYRLYAVKGDDRTVLRAAPSMAGIGLAIEDVHEEQKLAGLRFADLGQLGILDAVASEWIVLPWVRPVEPVTVGAKARRVRG